MDKMIEQLCDADRRMTSDSMPRDLTLEEAMEARARKRGIESALKKFLAGAAIIGAALICAGFYNGDQVRVETVYTVQPGDTLWDISEEYMQKNTGGRRYILEFMSGIRELNPWLLETHDQIQPGDRLTITYWVKKSEVESR
jgi:nucleoid-associated protein YgaU